MQGLGKTKKLVTKEKIISLRKIFLDSSAHFGNDDFVIALLTMVPTAAPANRAVALGQLELPYGN